MLTIGITARIAQIDGFAITAQVCNVFWRTQHTFPVKFSNDFVNKTLSGLKQSNSSESKIKTDPQERLQEDFQLTIDVKQTLRAV